MQRRIVRSIGVVVLAVLASGCAVSSWTQIGHDSAHTAHNDTERSLTAANVSALEESWSADLLADATEPMVRESRVYQSTASATQVRVKAFDAANGTVIWDTLVAENGCSRPTYTDATFVGDEIWTGYFFLGGDIRPCGIWSNPARLRATDGAVIGGDSGNISASPAVVLDDGADHATVQLRISFSLAATIVSIGDSPGTSWTGNVPGDVLANGPVSVAPTARDGMVHAAWGTFVHSFSLYGCGAEPCSPVWSADLGAKVTAVLDAGTAGDLYAAAGANLVSLDRSSGQATGIPLAGTISGMALVDTTLYVTAGTTLYALDTAGSGSLVWSKPLSAAASASPVAAGGVVYVGESDGAVEAFDASGNLLATVSVPGAVDHVTVAAGRLFVVSPGRLTAFAPG